MTFDPNEQRDAHGRWAKSGDSGNGGDVERHLLDPRVIDVSGDEWNRKTAERLEKEYAAVRPDIDAIAQEGVEKGASVASGQSDEEDEEDEEDDTPFTPEGWDDLSGSQQEEAEQHYAESHIDQEKEWVHNNWVDNGDPIYEAKHQLAEDDDFKSEWLSSYLAEREEDGDLPRIPFNTGDLLGAITITPGDSYDDDPDITFDEKYLDKPDNLDTETPTFPGIEPQNPAGFLTEKMREEITKDLIAAFNEEAKSKAEDIDPPYYLNEEAETNIQEAWGNMSDEEQFNYAMEHVDSLKDAEHNVPQRAPTSALAWPAEFDPLNTTSGTDYQRTQALAKYIADKRGAQLITERVGNAKWKPRDQFLGSDEDYKKLYEQPDSVGRKKDQAWTDRMLRELQSADLKLWSGWKGSSTNPEGRLLQVAASDELGGRIRDAKQPAWKDPANDPEEVKLAKSIVGDPSQSEEATGNHQLVIAAYKDGAPPEIIKALSLKAQGIASPANDKVVMDYFSHGAAALARSQIKETPLLTAEKVTATADDGVKSEFIRLPDVKIEKNGAASTTVSPTVANGWNGTTNNAPEGINKKESIEYANQAYAAIGGYEGVKAALRAKWETTQYLLDKADIPVVQAYRGITYDHKLKGDTGEDQGDFNPPWNGQQTVKSGDTVNLAESPIGTSHETQSGKTITKVSNEDAPSGHAPGVGTWKYSMPKETQKRMVLRAEVPRTAVVSIPAYGVNVKSEQEVVVAGSAWKGWDAWSGRAPTFEEVPMIHGIPKANEDAMVTLKDGQHS